MIRTAGRMCSVVGGQDGYFLWFVSLLVMSVLTIHTGRLHRGLNLSPPHLHFVLGPSLVRSLLYCFLYGRQPAKIAFVSISFFPSFVGRLGQLCLMSLSWAAKHSHRRTVLLDSNTITRRTADQIAGDLDGCVLTTFDTIFLLLELLVQN